MSTRPLQILLVCTSAGAGLAPLHADGSCSLGQPIKPIHRSVQFVSTEKSPAMVGFDEFVATTSAPRKYLVRTVTGEMAVTRYAQSLDCDTAPLPLEAQISFTDGTTTYGGGPFVGSASLTVQSSTATTITYVVGPLALAEGATAVACRLRVGSTIKYAGDTYVATRGDMLSVALETNYVYWTGVGPTVSIRAGEALANQDSWDIEQRWENGGAVTRRHSTTRRYAETATSPIPGGAHVTAGRPDRLYEPYVNFAGTVEEPTYVTVTTTAVERTTAGRGCVPGALFGPASMRSVGLVRERLTEEDTEEAAEARATSLLGTSNIAFRTSRGSGFSWTSRTVAYTAKFDFSCPGEYLFVVRYRVRPHNSAAVGEPKTKITVRRCEAGPQTLSGEFSPEQKDTDYVIEGIEAYLAPACGTNPAGTAHYDVNSIVYWLSLGRSAGSLSSGGFMINAATLDATLYTPAGLTLLIAGSAGFETIRTAAGMLRQVRTPQALADLVLLNPDRYEIRFYATAQIGARDPLSGIYGVSGSPYITHRFENPDPDRMTRLRITETAGSAVKVTEYRFEAATATWTLSTGNGLREESKAETAIGADRIKTETVRGPDGTIVRRIVRTYRTLPWGEELVSELDDPEGAARLTTYDYYTSGSGTDPNYGALRQRNDPTGNWERFTYDAAGRILKTVRPFLGAGPATVDEALCRVTEYIHDTLPDTDGDGLPEERTTTIERTLGHETGRRYRIDWTGTVLIGDDACRLRSDIVAVVAGSAWDAPDNLVNRTWSIKSGPFSGRVRRTSLPNGTGTLATYAPAADGTLTATVSSGRFDSGLTAIVDGRVQQTVSNDRGYTVAETTRDIATGLTLVAWTADPADLDSLGRPVRQIYDDGTFVSRTYACCGLASERDRSGHTAAYTYDALGRRETESSLGITLRNRYDAEGRVLSVTRIGTDGTELVLETNTYSRDGRLATQRDALARLTSYFTTTDPATGETTHLTSAPGNETTIEVYARDGSLLSQSGNAAAPRTYDYGIDADGVFTKETALGVDSLGQPTNTEWRKSYVDFAGRSSLVRYADGAVSRTFYNSVGQRVRQVDPDGVTLLYAYNARGEQDTVAVDLNGNHSIDYAGTDRITRTRSSIATRTDSAGIHPVTRSETLVWDTELSDTASLVSVVEQAFNGLRAWVSAEGLESRTITTLDGSGGRTVTRTDPDSTRLVQTFAHDRLLTTTTYAADGGRLSGEARTYDAHGRLETVTDARNGTTTFTYFPDDRLQSVTSPDPDPSRTGPGYEPQTTTFGYDFAGRQDRVTHPDSGVVVTTYWPTGAVRGTSGIRTYPVEYTYDPQGRLKTLTTWRDFASDTGRAVTTWTYDPIRGWLTHKRYADGKGPTYAYRASGRMLSRTWARTPTIATTYGYNAAGDLETTDYSDSTPDVALAYDRRGRVKSVSDAAGQRTFGYHTSGQLEDESYTSGPLQAAAITRTFDSLHRLSSLTARRAPASNVATVTYGYDPGSRLESITSGPTTASYRYHPDSSLLQTLTIRHGTTERLTTTRTYDRLNRLAAISNQPAAAGMPPISHSYDYDAANHRTRATRADASYWTYGYDALGQVTAGRKRLSDNTATPGHDYAWTFDDIGNRKSATLNSRVSDYTANTLNQYTERTVPGVVDVTGAASVGATVTVSVDGGPPAATDRQGESFHRQVIVENTTTARRPKITVTGVRNSVGPQGEDAVTTLERDTFVAKTPEEYRHDDDGNLTSDGRWLYTWDAENRLIAMQTRPELSSLFGGELQRLEFAYDSGGRRIRKQVSATNGTTSALTMDRRFIYDGWNLVAELDGLAGNALIQSYTWGLDLSGSLQGAGGVGGLLWTAAPGASHAFTMDGNGNISASLDITSGQITHESDYGPFGEPIPLTGTNPSPFGFSTKYPDPERGILYYGYRYYNPSNGRWLSRDPIGENGGYNIYIISGNNNISNIDILGLILAAFDGTNNDRDRDEWGGKTNSPTNVAIMAALYNGPIIYRHGVGTRTDITTGNLFGAGTHERLEASFEKLKNYLSSNPDEPVDIIGFSRGAASARIFANKVLRELPCARIRFLGLFDSVAQFGAPNPFNFQFGYDLSIDLPRIGYTAHVAAKDEKRILFPLTSISNAYATFGKGFRGKYAPDEFLEIIGPNYWEKPFHGVHSEGGGGYQDTRNIDALRWMIQRGQDTGAPFLNLERYDHYDRLVNISGSGNHDSRYPFLDRIPFTRIGRKKRLVFSGGN